MGIEEDIFFKEISKNPEIILGKRLKRKIKDNSMDSLFIATEDISNIFSDSIINNTLTDCERNLIVLDFKENFYIKTFQNRKNIGKVIKISEEDLYYNPFWSVENIKYSLFKEYSLFKKEIFKKYKELVTEMYEITEKYFFMDTRYKAYSIDLIISAIYFLKNNNKEVNLKGLIDFFSSSKEPLEDSLIEILEKEKKEEIYRPIVDFLNISYSERNNVKISINNVLKIFENRGVSEYANYLNIEELFAKKKYTLYISLSSIEDKISRGKVKFLINQILKNRDQLELKVFVILPDFKILNEIPELKEMLFYEEEHRKIKLLLVSNILNLLKLEENILEKRKIVLDSESVKKLKKLKYFKKFSIGKKLEKHELLYIDNSILRKINKINCEYDEEYVIKQCLKYTIIILLICLYSNLRFNS